MLSSRGVQTTQRRWNPLTAKWEKKDRKRECLVPSSCLVFYLFFPRLSLTKGKQQWTTTGSQEDRGKSPSHIEPRLFFFPFFLYRSQVGRSQMLQVRHQMSLVVDLKRWRTEVSSAIHQWLVKISPRSFVWSQTKSKSPFQGCVLRLTLCSFRQGLHTECHVYWITDKINNILQGFEWQQLYVLLSVIKNNIQ